MREFFLFGVIEHMKEYLVCEGFCSFDQLSQGGVFCAWISQRIEKLSLFFFFMAALFDALNFDFARGRLMMDHQI